MKHYILLLAALLTAAALQAQTPADSTLTQAQHQKFKGVEITGTKDAFFRQLYKNGYSEMQPASDQTMYAGIFAGYKVETTVMETPITKTVYSVVAALPRRVHFEESYEDFKTLLGHLTAVYGQPADRHEEFKSPYTRGDGYSIKALKEGKANFQATWNTGPGIILIKIINTPDSASRLLLAYTDIANEETNENEKTEIIRRDL